MTNDYRTSDDIERDIADDRAQISGTLDDLREKFSFDAIVNDFGTIFRDQGGELGRKISETMGRNPPALVLVGVGLAWLFLGQGRKTSASPAEKQWGQVPDSHRDGGASASWDNGSLRLDRSNEGGNGMMGAVGDAANSARDTVSDTADKFGHTTSGLTEWLSHGLDDLSEEAKSRVMSARRAAHEARVSSGDAMRRGARQASDFLEDQPLVVGALAVAVGAAIGGMLPNSKGEDDAVGESSDRLFAQAQEMLREERDKAKAVLQTTATDINEEIEDAKSDAKAAGEKVVDRASESAERVMKGARDEAENQGLGQSKN